MEPAKYQAIDFAKDHPLWRSAVQNIELVAKNEEFGLQCRSRPEQPGCSAPDEPEEFAHRADYQPIRGMTSAVEFPVGTAMAKIRNRNAYGPARLSTEQRHPRK